VGADLVEEDGGVITEEDVAVSWSWEFGVDEL
jgi:hypothetical protein